MLRKLIIFALVAVASAVVHASEGNQSLPAERLIAAPEFKLAPRVIGTGDGWRYISTRTPFFVDAPLTSASWSVYRPVTVFERRLETSVVQMVSLKKIAQASLVRTLDALSELELVTQSQEVRPNDILLPIIGPDRRNTAAQGGAPSTLNGTLIGHMYGSQYVGLHQIVVVDRGETDGLHQGHKLTVIQQGAVIKGHKESMRYDSDVDNSADPVLFQLPAQSVGSVQVIKSYPYFSLAIVVNASTPLKAQMPVMAVGADDVH